ncbi:MAG: ABC transporter permease [Anaerolineae bacterium]|jgi:simple sugar transport system permease protein
MKQRLKSYFSSQVIDAFLPVFATLAALLVGAFMLLALGANPFVAYGALIQGAFGSVNSIADTLVRATPLLFVGVGICIAFRGGVTNIGGEGQFVAGALCATMVGLSFPDGPALLIVPLSLLAGALGGAIWGGIPGLLKAHFNVNEILSTIMMNQIAVQGMNFLLLGPLIDPIQLERASRIPQTSRLSPAFDLPRLVPTRLHLGTLIAVVMAVLVYLLLWRTTLGYRIRAVGLNRAAARYAGINVPRHIVLALALSGALAGLAGAVQVFGVNFRMFTDGSATGFTGSAGFHGIVAALFGQLHPLGTIPAAFFFGGLLVGANRMQRAVQVPAALIVTLNGLVVVFVVSTELWRQQRARRRLAEQATEAEAEYEDAQASAATAGAGQGGGV